MKKNTLPLAKRLTAALLGVCLALSCALPALADEPAAMTETVTLASGTNQNGTGWTWDGTNQLLTLSGVTVNVTGKNGFVLPAGSSVSAKEGTVNKITVSGENAVAFSVTGTPEAGKAAFTLGGTGQLTVSTDSSKKITDASSCAVNGGVTYLPAHVEGAVTVTQTGGILFRGNSGTAVARNILLSNLDLTGKTLAIRDENSAIIIPDGITVTGTITNTNNGKLAYGGTAEQANAIAVSSLPSGTSYQVTVLPPTGGTVSKDQSGSYCSGAVTLSCTPNPGYVFESFTVNGADIAGDTFTPTQTSTVSARLRPVAKVTSLTPTLTNSAIHVGSSTGLNVAIAPDNADDKGYTVTSDNPAIATVSNNGQGMGWLVNGIAPGTATITVASNDGGATAQVAVTVEAAPTVPVDTIAFVPEMPEHTLKQNASKQLFVVVKPDNATDKAVTFTSSNPAVATVDANGNVTGLGVGTAVITATAGGKSTTCTFIVESAAIPSTGVALNLTTLTLPVGQNQKLTATLTPAETTDTVTFTSSNPAVAAVLADGTVTAIAPGTATITATTASGKTAQCAVTVTPVTIPVAGIALDNTALTLTEGLVGKLTATVLPTDATDKTVAFTSSDAAIASVDANGIVTARKPGTAVITAKAGDKTAQCTVTVNSAVVPVTGITLSRSGLAMTKGQAETLAATVKPDNATEKAVTFTSSNPAVATVDSQGRVVAVSAGTAVITAKAGDKTVQCPVAVTVPVTGVYLNRGSVGVLQGAVFTLTATVQPADASNKGVSFTSTNTRVATVDSSGKVTALTAGTAEIIATAAGGHMSRCTVTVSSPSSPATDDSITGDAFWDRIVSRLDSARAGATVAVNAGNRLEIPTAVLEELEGTNNTLLIHWSGRDISIDGRDMDDLAFDRDTYALRTLSGLYGISEEEEEEFEEEDWDDFEFEEIYFEDDEPAAPNKKPASDKTEDKAEKDDKKDEANPPAASGNNTATPPQNGSSQNSTPTQDNSTQNSGSPQGSTPGTSAPSTPSGGEGQGGGTEAPDEEPPTADSTDDIDMTPVEGEDTTPSVKDGEDGPVLAPIQEEKKQNHWGVVAIAGAGVMVVGSAATAICLRIRSKNRWDDAPF